MFTLLCLFTAWVCRRAEKVEAQEPEAPQNQEHLLSEQEVREAWLAEWPLGNDLLPDGLSKCEWCARPTIFVP
jgi:hypothetical protein